MVNPPSAWPGFSRPLSTLGCGLTLWNAYPYMAWWWSHGLPLVVGFPMTCLPYVQMAQHTRTTPHRWSTCPPQSTCAVPSAISSRLPPGPLPDRSSPSGAPSSLARRARSRFHARHLRAAQRQVLRGTALRVALVFIVLFGGKQATLTLCHLAGLQTTH